VTGVTFRLFGELVGMTVTDPTDIQIVRRTLAGDVEAFALLVDRYHGSCLTVAVGILADADDAEDAVQDAFVRGYRALASYEDRERFGAWMLRIVVNQCRTHVARRRRWVQDTAGAEGSFLEALPDPAGTPADHAEASSRREELARALARLGADQREAVLLRFGAELSFDEMASVTGVGVSALKMRVQRACARLRTLLTEHLHA
jgi:RNA polymerase sigma-70 factor (ECF subfamily)